MPLHTSRCSTISTAVVLVPNDPAQATQALDVRDLIEFATTLPHTTTPDIMDAVGQSHPLGDYLSTSAEIADFQGSLVHVPSDWLLAQGVPPAFGPGSLPLWGPNLDRYGAQAGELALQHGLVRRPLNETLADMLRDECARGLGRERFSGMSRARELQLISAWRSKVPPAIGGPTGE